jgi:hypothetical protein
MKKNTGGHFEADLSHSVLKNRQNCAVLAILEEWSFLSIFGAQLFQTG